MEDNSQSEHLRRNVGVMSAGNTLTTSANSLWIMFIPFFFTDIGISPIFIGVAFTIFSASSAITYIIGGKAADRFGRKPILLLGYSIYSSGPLLILLAVVLSGQSNLLAVILSVGGYAWMMAGRGLARPASSILLVESSAEHRKGLSYMLATRVLPSIPPALLVLIGNDLYFSGLFWVAVLIGFLSLVPMVISYSLFLRESLTIEEPLKSQETKTRPSLIGMFLILIIIAFALDSMSSSGLSWYVPIYVRPINEFLYGWMISISTLVIAASALISGYLVDKVGIRYALTAGWSLLAVTVTLFPFYGDVVSILVLYSIWAGLDMMDISIPALVIEKHYPKESRATALGTFSTSISLISILGPAMVSFALLFGDAIPFFLKAVMNTLGILIFVYSMRYTQREK